MASRPARRFAKGPKRSTLWIQFDWTRATMTAEGGTLLFVLNTAASALLPFTVVRSHFMINAISDQGSANESQFGAFGIAVVSVQASTIGVSAIPTPVTDAGSDLFFVHQYYIGHGLGTGVAAPGGVNVNSWVIDSKAMRKVNEDEDIVVVGEFDSEGGGHIISAAGRMLLKLH